MYVWQFNYATFLKKTRNAAVFKCRTVKASQHRGLDSGFYRFIVISIVADLNSIRFLVSYFKIRRSPIMALVRHDFEVNFGKLNRTMVSSPEITINKLWNLKFAVPRTCLSIFLYIPWLLVTLSLRLENEYLQQTYFIIKLHVFYHTVCRKIIFLSYALVWTWTLSLTRKHYSSFN